MPPDAPDADLILAGGGLANALVAWRLRTARPDLSVLLLEAGDRLGGNHTWSFHEHDLTADQHAWLGPLVTHRWAGHEVRFPGHARRLGSAYLSVTSERLHARLMDALGSRVRLGAPVEAVKPTTVRLADGTALRGHAVLDGRGLAPSPHLWLGYQKFLGQEVRLARPHGLSDPILMDATVEQIDGYRFVYVLPFAPDCLLIEDTYYSNSLRLDLPSLRERISAYAEAQGWPVADLLREETGVLPITLGGDPRAFWRKAGPVPRSGLRAGLFHPTTGYSLPDAVRLADLVAGLPDLSAPALAAAIRAHALAAWRGQRFFRLLNRLLFLAGRPEERRGVMRRFYRLPEPLIQRFYAGRPSAADRLRLLVGKPPVPLGEALRALTAHGPAATPHP